MRWPTDRSGGLTSASVYSIKHSTLKSVKMVFTFTRNRATETTRARCPDTVLKVNQTLRLKHLKHEVVTLVDGTTREEKAELLRLPLTRMGEKLGARIRSAHAFVSAPLRPEFMAQVKISTEYPVAITAELERQTTQTAIRWSVLYGIYPDEA